MSGLFTAIFINLLSILLGQQAEKKEFIRTIEARGNSAEELFEEMNIRYNNAVLIQEIGQATSAILRGIFGADHSRAELLGRTWSCFFVVIPPIRFVTEAENSLEPSAIKASIFGMELFIRRSF